MSGQAPKPRRAQGEEVLRSELDRLVAIDELRNEHTAALRALQSQRDQQVGRMQMLAEQQGIDLEGFVGIELTKREAAS